MRLSIIIPVHNEERFVAHTLEKVSKLALNCEKEVIVVDDGSTDKTPEILARLQRELNFKLITHQNNLGKGAAVRDGFAEATGDQGVIQDADLEYDPIEIPKLLSFMNPGISAVYGSRRSPLSAKRGFHYILGAKVLSWTLSLLYRTRIRDVYTGYKLFNLYKLGKSFFENIKSQGFEFEAEVTCRILKMGGKIVEVPLEHYTPRGRREGKHIGFRDALKGLFTILSLW